MKDNEKESNVKEIGNSLIRTCPVCGFSFRTTDPKTRKKIVACPMCGYKFIEPDILPNGNNSLNKRFF